MLGLCPSASAKENMWCKQNASKESHRPGCEPYSAAPYKASGEWLNSVGHRRKMVPCGHQILEPGLIPLVKCGVSALSGTWVTECCPSTSPGPEPCKGELWVESLGSGPYFLGPSSIFFLRGSKKYQDGWQRSPCIGLLQCDGCQEGPFQQLE